jgi:hypothetical protein
LTSDKRYGLIVPAMVNTDTLNLDDYKAFRRRIETGYAALQKRIDVERHQAIEALNEAWPKMGGSEKDIARFEKYHEAPSRGESTVTHDPKHEVSTLNGSYKRSSTTIPMNDVRKAALDVWADDEIETITQTIIQHRVLAEYPHADVQRLRVYISRLLRELEGQNMITLIEKGKGGNPSKYRKNKDVEVGLLKSGP